MNIEIAKHGRMTESGSSLLRLIQNQSTPLLDLLVRESLQNSLDACIKFPKHKFVKVEINCPEFRAPELNKHFDKITAALNNRYPDSKKYKCLTIADHNTTGLTGPVSYEEVRNNNFGNLLKLVYEISKPQHAEGAGGSWGLGKTIYFRVGIGLVIYYSRIRTKTGQYESRLAACLVEDETKADALIPSSGGVRRGIAWWGSERHERQGKCTVPITKETEIRSILSVFGAEPYKEQDTGTMILIPYVDEEKILKETYADEAEENAVRPYWTKSIEEYIRIAVQRWYAPRIMNEEWPYGPYLNAWVGNKIINVSDMQPLFRAIRNMYICQLSDDKHAYDFPKDIHCEDIQVRNVLLQGSSAGRLVFAKMTKEELKMTAPDNMPSPYLAIENRQIDMEHGNAPIITYTRMPGMLVEYDYKGPWTSRMPRTTEDEFIVGLFVVNSKNTMKSMNALTVEEYIRSSEKADHASWNDKSYNDYNPRLISKIQNGVNNKVRGVYSETVYQPKHKENPGLGRALAGILLPSEGFGAMPVTPPGPSTTHGERRYTRHSVITITGAPDYKAGNITIPYLLHPVASVCRISLLIDAEIKKYSAAEWEDADEIGRQFPLSFVAFSVDERRTIKGKDNWEPVQHTYVPDFLPDYPDGICVNFERNINTGSIDSLTVNIPEKTDIKGHLCFKSTDPSVRVAFGVQEVKE